MASVAGSQENPPDVQVIGEKSTPITMDKGTSQASVLVKSIFADPEALHLLRSALNVQADAMHNSVPTRASKALTKQPESQTNGTGALKAHIAAWTMVDTVSIGDGDVNPPQSKQPRMSESFDDLDEAEEEFPAPSSRWLASEQLAAFLETFRKPLQSFERKTICRNFPRPDVDAVYTPMLDEYLASIVPGIKQADKETKFLQDRVLDAVGPIAFMYEHLNDLLSHAKVLSSEQVQTLFSASSHGAPFSWQCLGSYGKRAPFHRS